MDLAMLLAGCYQWRNHKYKEMECIDCWENERGMAIRGDGLCPIAKSLRRA